MDLVAHVPTFSITPYGVLAHIFVINWRGLIIALLGWFEGAHRCGLILNPCEHPIDPQHQLFDIGIELEGGRFRRRTIFRVVTFTESEEEDWEQVASAGWRDVYLSHRPPSNDSSLESSPSKAWRAIEFSSLSLNTPFCFSQEHTTGLDLIDARGLLFGDRPILPWTGAEPLVLRLSFNLSLPRRETATLRNSLASTSTTSLGRAGSFCVVVGRCTNPARGFSPKRLGPHWLNVKFEPDASAHAGEHSCLTDHVTVPERPLVVWRHWQCPIENGENLNVGFEQCSYNPRRLIVTLTDDSHKAAQSYPQSPEHRAHTGRSGGRQP